ncbi:Uncharacterised protein [uncultured archaeon]|nr:Uncharacterised protein [uncultured archaeon]
MSEAIGCESPQNGENLLGLLEYYEAVLDREGLAARVGDVRSLKLGMILDLIKTVNIPEGLGADLAYAVLNAWEMNSRNEAPSQGKEELKAMLRSIADIRSEIERARRIRSPIASIQTDAAVMIALPLMPSDLRANEVPKIHSLLEKVMDNFAAGIGQEVRSDRFPTPQR